jgi:two-component system NtrC family sensor kinase
MKKTAETNSPQTFELHNVISKKHHEVVSQPAHDNDDNIEGVIHIYRDRTREKNLWDQLLQSEKLASIGLLSGGIAHEINNPLGGILIFSQMILKEMAPSSPHYDDVVEIEAAAQRCKHIVENLLQFSRPSSQHIIEKLEPVNAAEVIELSLKLALAGKRHKNYEIIRKFPADPVYFAGNKNKAIQLLLNLIVNACHAMPSGGKLTLGAAHKKEKHGKVTVLTIKDTGIGIGEEELTKIFDPFFTTKDIHEGTGLGLSICHGIVKEFKGAINVTSKFGKGTTFTITLTATNDPELGLPHDGGIE